MALVAVEEQGQVGKKRCVPTISVLASIKMSSPHFNLFVLSIIWTVRESYILITTIL